MAIPGGGWTCGTTRAALEWVGLAESGAGVDDGGEGGVANMLVATRREKRTVENTVRNVFFECVMGRFPMRTP